MKKALVFLLVLGMVTPLFADDAKVLPEKVLRIYTVPVVSFVTGTWDADGELTENEDDAGDGMPDGTIFSLGGRRINKNTDQISAGFQWTPVYSFLKPVDIDTGTDSDVLTGGIDSVDVGAEIQILGNQGYVQNDQMRFSVTPGVVVPMPTRDWESEGEAAVDGDDYVAPGAETLTQFAVGALVNFDYLVTPEFYVNVFLEPRFRLPRTVDYSGFYNPVATAEVDAASRAAGGPGFDDDVYDTYEVEYGSNVFFETGLDFNYELPVSESVRVDFGLPARFTLNTPRTDTETVEVTDAGAAAGQADQENEFEPDDPSYTLYLDPSIGTFLTGLPVPLQFVATYRLPLVGQRASQVHSVVLEGRVYLSF